MDIMVVGESSGKGQAVIPPTPYGARLLAHLDFSSMGPDSVRLFGSDFFPVRPQWNLRWIRSEGTVAFLKLDTEELISSFQESSEY
jgi:hypothetical protein